jgi:hypothetical protein
MQHARRRCRNAGWVGADGEQQGHHRRVLDGGTHGHRERRLPLAINRVGVGTCSNQRCDGGLVPRPDCVLERQPSGPRPKRVWVLRAACDTGRLRRVAEQAQRWRAGRTVLSRHHAMGRQGRLRQRGCPQRPYSSGCCASVNGNGRGKVSPRSSHTFPCGMVPQATTGLGRTSE